MRALGDLSRKFGTIKKARRLAYDSPLGPLPMVQLMMNVAAASDTAVHAAITLAAGAETVVTSGITNPDVYRPLRIKGNQVTVDGSVTIKGTDWADNVITDVIEANGTAAVEGTVAFKTVTEITVPARGAASDSISVGYGTAVGLYRPITADADVIRVVVDTTAEAPGTVNEVEGTVVLTTAPNGAHDYEIWYNASQA